MGALGSLVWWEGSVPTEGGLELDGLYSLFQSKPSRESRIWLTVYAIKGEAGIKVSDRETDLLAFFLILFPENRKQNVFSWCVLQQESSIFSME